MPTDISHYPEAAAVLYEFLDAKIPLSRDDLERRLGSMEPHILGDHLDGLWRIGMLRKLKGDNDPYVLTPLAMESADLFGEDGWHEGEVFWKRWEKAEERFAHRTVCTAAAAGLGMGCAVTLAIAVLRKAGRR